jgi:hypothetical protein
MPERRVNGMAGLEIVDGPEERKSDPAGKG